MHIRTNSCVLPVARIGWRVRRQVESVVVETWGESQVALGDTVTATITIARAHAPEYRGFLRRCDRTLPYPTPTPTQPYATPLTPPNLPYPAPAHLFSPA